MDSIELTRTFMSGQILDTDGATPLAGREALLTRRSLLLFGADRVLKLRRPRFVDGRDQTHQNMRWAQSLEESATGRRLNRTVHQDVHALVLDAASERIGLRPGFSPDGEPVVVTRRLPDELRADRRIASDAPRDRVVADLEQVMRRLARFHIHSGPFTKPPLADPARTRHRFEAALTAAAPASSPAEVARLTEETGVWLEALAPLLAHRIQERRVRALHHELRLGHLFLSGPGLDGVAFIDPYDGDDPENVADTAEDIASLAVELDAALGREASDRVIDVYLEATVDNSYRRVARLFKRISCLRRAAEALAGAADAETDGEDLEERARFFAKLALRT